MRGVGLAARSFFVPELPAEAGRIHRKYLLRILSRAFLNMLHISVVLCYNTVNSDDEKE